MEDNILEKLHCSKCNEYLSYAPIMITEDGRNLCGKCVNKNSNIKLTRNHVYEDLAAKEKFPCRYKQTGCKNIIPWENVIVHEDNCEYRSAVCPMTPIGSCKWNGPQCTLLDHVKEMHRELIQEHLLFVE